MVTCKAVKSYWGNVRAQIFQNYFATSNSEVNSLKHMRGTSLFWGSVLRIFRNLGLFEALALSGVWTCKVVSHFSKRSLFDEPGLIWSQNDGGCDMALQRLQQRRWSYPWHHLGHLVCFCHIFAEETSGLEWTSFTERPWANEVLNWYF